MDEDVALQDYTPLTTPAGRQLLHAGGHCARRVLEFKDLIQGFDATMKYLPLHLSEQEARADLIDPSDALQGKMTWALLPDYEYSPFQSASRKSRSGKAVTPSNLRMRGSRQTHK
jgi:hypothetical protein